MTKDNSTEKNKDFYDLGKKIFDRLNPQIAHNPKVIGPVQEPVAWMVYTQDGQSVYVTDNPTDIKEGQRALPLYTTPQQRPWVGLTEDEVAQAMYRADAIFTGPMQFKFAQEIEAKLKEKNDGSR
jgi:hypothetical protein